MFVCCECCVLSGRGLRDELITRPEESCRMWCVVVWSRNIKNEEAMTRVGSQRPPPHTHARARAHARTKMSTTNLEQGTFWYSGMSVPRELCSCVQVAIECPRTFWVVGFVS